MFCVIFCFPYFTSFLCFPCFEKLRKGIVFFMNLIFQKYRSVLSYYFCIIFFWCLSSRFDFPCFVLSGLIICKMVDKQEQMRHGKVSWHALVRRERVWHLRSLIVSISFDMKVPNFSSGWCTYCWCCRLWFRYWVIWRRPLWHFTTAFVCKPCWHMWDKEVNFIYIYSLKYML